MTYRLSSLFSRNPSLQPSHTDSAPWTRLSSLLAGLALILGLVAATPQTLLAQRPLQFTAQSDTIDLLGLEQSFRNVARTVSSSVVAITASTDAAPADGIFRSSELTYGVMDRMLRGGPRIVGTGFCIDSDGYIVTNEHVVHDARQLFVTTDAGQTYPAIVVGSDPRSDLAVLKIPGELPVVEWGDPSGLYRGQWTIAIGNPVGLASGGAMSMSVGIVSAVGRDLPKLSEREGRQYNNLIQTTAEVNPGNSGGPLFDLQGNVIGIVTAVVLPHKSTNGLGFAIPADAILRSKIEQLKKGSPVVYGYLGIAVQENVGPGVWVTTIGEKTPAEKVLQPNDLLVRIDGRTVTDEASFVRMIGAAPTDRPVTLVVRRNGQELALNVRLEAREDVSAGVDVSKQRLFWRGLTLGVARNHPNGGVKVYDVDPESPLLSQGIEPGAVIRQIAGKPVHDLISLMEVVNETPVELCHVSLTPATDTARTAYASGDVSLAE